MNEQYLARLEKIEAVLKEKLPASFSAEWKAASYGKLPDAVSDEDLSKLAAPCTELVSLGGKRWRPLLQVLSAEMVSGLKEGDPALSAAYRLTPLVEFVHTASLIHDDIEDNTDMRRGKPAAHLTYGLDVALNAGSWLYFQAARCINDEPLSAELKNTLYNMYLTELRRLHLGQSLDIQWHRDKPFIPEQDQYLAMTRLKTGTLASLAAQTGALAGGATADEARFLGETAASIGIGFQVLDDVINLTSGNKGKKRGDDIVEGKKSLPVILHLKENPDDKKLITDYFNRASVEGPDSPAVEKCVTLLNESGAVAKAAEISRKLITESCGAIVEHWNGNEAAGLISALFTGMLA